MNLITSRAHLLANVGRLRDYLSRRGADRDFALERIERGICFVVTDFDSQLMFAPSRFVGYQQNDRNAHSRNRAKSGRATNPAITAILGSPPETNRNIEAQYEAFCREHGDGAKTPPFRSKRKFWDLRGHAR